jgi:hypothetical protein
MHDAPAQADANSPNVAQEVVSDFDLRSQSSCIGQIDRQGKEPSLCDPHVRQRPQNQFGQLADAVFHFRLPFKTGTDFRSEFINLDQSKQVVFISVDQDCRRFNAVARIF